MAKRLQEPSQAKPSQAEPSQPLNPIQPILNPIQIQFKFNSNSIQIQFKTASLWYVSMFCCWCVDVVVFFFCAIAEILSTSHSEKHSFKLSILVFIQILREIMKFTVHATTNSTNLASLHSTYDVPTMYLCHTEVVPEIKCSEGTVNTECTWKVYLLCLTMVDCGCQKRTTQPKTCNQHKQSTQTTKQTQTTQTNNKQTNNTNNTNKQHKHKQQHKQTTQTPTTNETKNKQTKTTHLLFSSHLKTHNIPSLSIDLKTTFSNMTTIVFDTSREYTISCAQHFLLENAIQEQNTTPDGEGGAKAINNNNNGAPFVWRNLVENPALVLKTSFHDPVALQAAAQVRSLLMFARRFVSEE